MPRRSERGTANRVRAIEADGSYHLFTRKPNDGIMPGTYNVMVSVWKGQHEPVSLIDERYSASATTPFKNVKIDRDRDDLNFEIEAKPGAGVSADSTAETVKPGALTTYLCKIRERYEL